MCSLFAACCCCLICRLTELEVLASLEHDLVRLRALSALELQHNLTSSLHLLVENGLRLTTITALLAIVAALSLSSRRSLSGLLLQTAGKE